MTGTGTGIDSMIVMVSETVTQLETGTCSEIGSKILTRDVLRR